MLGLEQITRPSFGTVPQWPGAVGRVFYVHHANGVDAANRGHDPSAPLATITYALGLCTDGNNDYILVLDAWQEAMPIVVNKKCVHVIGVGSLTPSRPSPCLAPADDNAVFSISPAADLCEIAGFTLGGGATHGCIEIAGGGPYGCYIHDCVLGHPNCGGTPLYGFWDIGANAQNFRFERLVILGNGGNVGGTITSDGIRLQGGPRLHTQIIDCVIMGVDICLNLGNVDGGIIARNILAPNTDGAGMGITLGAGCLGCVVADNMANCGDTEGGNPYTDNAAAGANHWMANKGGGGGLANTPYLLPA